LLKQRTNTKLMPTTLQTHTRPPATTTAPTKTHHRNTKTTQHLCIRTEPPPNPSENNNFRQKNGPAKSNNKK
jgi:hypothetical protein